MANEQGARWPALSELEEVLSTHHPDDASTLVAAIDRLAHEVDGGKTLQDLKAASSIGIKLLQDDQDTATRNTTISTLQLLVRVIQSAPQKKLDGVDMSQLVEIIADSTLSPGNGGLGTYLLLLDAVLKRQAVSLPGQARLRTLVDKVFALCFFGRGTIGIRTHPLPQDRQRPAQTHTSPLAIRDMVDDRQARLSKTVSKKASSSSLASSRRTHSELSCRALPDISSDPIAVRTLALDCLWNLVKLDPKPFREHWTVLLDPRKPSLVDVAQTDPVPDARVLALRVIASLFEKSQAHLALARDHPSKGAFVSQSQTLADLIGHLHIRLTDILQRHTSAPKGDIVQVEALNVAEILSKNSPYAQLRPGLLAGVISAVSGHLSSINLTLPDKAADCLAASVQASLSTETLRAATLPGCQKLLAQYIPDSSDVQPAASPTTQWKVLSVLLSRDDVLARVANLNQVYALIEQSFKDADTPTKLHQLDCLIKLAKISGGNNASAESNRCAALVTKYCMQSTDPSIKLKLLVMVSSRHYRTLSLERLEALILDITQDHGKSVRGQAYRLLGTVLDNYHQELTDSAVVRLILALKDALQTEKALSAKAEAAWTLANLLTGSIAQEMYVSLCRCLARFSWRPDDDASSSSAAKIGDLRLEIFDIVLPLSANASNSKEGELLQTSATRIVGALMTDQAHALDLERSAAAFQAFNAALVKPTPKAQWNAATVIRAIILQRPEVPPYIIETMLDVLSSSKNVKVKASIFAALENVKDLRRIPDALEKLLAAKDSLQAMRDDLPFAELGRAETLMASIQAFHDSSHAGAVDSLSSKDKPGSV